MKRKWNGRKASASRRNPNRSHKFPPQLPVAPRRKTLRQAVSPQRIVQIPLLLAPRMKPLKIKAAMINRAAMMAKGAR